MKVFTDPAAPVTAVAGTLLVAALAVSLDERRLDAAALRCSARAPCSACSCARPRAIAGLRRHHAADRRARAGVPAGGARVLGTVRGRLRLQLRLRHPQRDRGAMPLAIIALAALGGLILIADDLRTRFGLAQRGLTPWQRLTGTSDTPMPAPWRALGGLTLVGLALILGLGLHRQ